MGGVTDTGTILIRGARQLLTLRGPNGARRGADLDELGIIPDGALLIRDGLIDQVGPSRRLENVSGARDAIEINAAGRVVMPGFVDSHTHPLFPPPGIPASDFENAVRSVRSATAKRLAAHTRSQLQSMARHGTTTVEAKTGCGPDDRAELKLLRVLATLQRDPVDVVPTLLLRLPAGVSAGHSANEAADWFIRELLPRVRQRGLARFVDVAWDANVEVHAALGRCLEAARSQGFSCKIHADQESPSAAISMAMGQVGISVDHLEHATKAEVALMAGGRTVATLLPYPSFQSRRTGAPARALIDAGVPLALASDFSPRYAPNLNMQVVVALACLHMELTPAEAISAATINGAYALDCGDKIGSLELQKEADLLILNISDYREMAHHFGTNLVHLTMKRGEFIYKEGEVAKQTVEDVHPAW
jgi:imidazolonepropionase